EIPLDAVERSVEALGGRRQILHKVGYLTCELERSGWDTHRSAGDGLRGLRCRLCGLRRRLRGSLDVFRARNLLALHMTTMPYAGTTVWDLPGCNIPPETDLFDRWIGDNTRRGHCLRRRNGVAGCCEGAFSSVSTAPRVECQRCAPQHPAPRKCTTGRSIPHLGGWRRTASA